MNEQDLHKKVWEAARAREILENESWKWAFATIEEDIYTQWKSSKGEADRENLHKFHLMLNKVRETLESRVQTGQLAELTLAHHKTLADRAKEIWRS